MRTTLTALSLGALLLATAGGAHAQTAFTQWNFNSNPADGNTATGLSTPSLGSGAAALLGGTTATFAGGDVNGNSTDPASGDDSAWNTTGYPGASAGSLTAGVQFLTSTVGWESVAFTFDIRPSNTASRYLGVQYTLNGTTWINAAASLLTAGTPSIGGNTDAVVSGLFEATGGEVWYNARRVDFSSIAGAGNNANFGVRVLTAFAPGTSSYAAAETGSTYGSAGTLRYDMATFSGTRLSAAVPEPGTLALAGLGLLPLAGLALARRRNAARN